jgi:predicted CopG family antitoxin
MTRAEKHISRKEIKISRRLWFVPFLPSSILLSCRILPIDTDLFLKYLISEKYVSPSGVCITMAKKVTISVPDELYEKMVAWKSSMNFSRVFQNAVSGMIQKKEALTSRIRNEIDFSAVVDRLKKEKIDYEFNIAECGKKDGLEWCKTAHYDELQYALAWTPYKDPDRDQELGEYFSQMFEAYKKRLTATGQKAQDYLSGFSEKYVRGWKEGVDLFWSEVKDKL